MGAGGGAVLEAGAFAVAALATAALLFGLQGIEVASWFAGIAGVLIASGVLLLTPCEPRSAVAAPDDALRAAGSQRDDFRPADRDF